MTDSEPTAGGPEMRTASGAGGYLRSTLKHGSIYGIGLILSRIISFVMIPVYTRVLTPADYGVLEVLSLTADIVAMLAGMGIGTAVTRYYYFYETEKERNAVASSAALLVIGVFGAVALIGSVFAAPIAHALLGPEASVGLVRLALVNLAIGSSLEIPLILLRARQQSSSAVGVGLARLVIGLALNILLVVVFRFGVAGILISSITASTILSVFMLGRMFRETGVRIDWTVVRRMIAFGAPLVVWNLGSFVLHFSDRYFLRVYVSLDAVGIYALSYKLAMLVSIFISGPFNDIWVPKVLEIDRREGERAPAILVGILAHYSLLLVAAALGIALFAGDIIRLAAGPDFRSAAAPVPLLALAMVLFGYRGLTNPGAVIRERSDLIARSTLVAAAAAIALNALLIPRWGVMGAAAATAGAFALEFALMRFLVLRVYPLHVPLRRTLTPLLVATLVWFAAEAMTPQGAGLVLSVALRCVAYGVFILLLTVPGVLPRDQRTDLLAATRDPLRTLRAIRSG
jgi:O-antigen/teichoic acid export membrane protein